MKLNIYNLFVMKCRFSCQAGHVALVGAGGSASARRHRRLKGQNFWFIFSDIWWLEFPLHLLTQLNCFAASSLQTAGWLWALDPG